jgi:aminopeptidase N
VAPFSPDAEAAGRRALRNAVLDLLAADPHSLNVERASGHFEAAANMTDSMGGLAALMLIGGEGFDAALEKFYERWKDEPLVVDKWFALQARDPSPEVLERVKALTSHPAFEPKNPNRPPIPVVSTIQAATDTRSWPTRSWLSTRSIQ